MHAFVVDLGLIALVLVFAFAIMLVLGSVTKAISVPCRFHRSGVQGRCLVRISDWSFHCSTCGATGYINQTDGVWHRTDITEGPEAA